MAKAKAKYPDIVQECRRCGETRAHAQRSRRGRVEIFPECRECKQLRDIHYQMIQRCDNPKHRKYAEYGGRGIKVDPSFYDLEAWKKHMKARPDGFQIERIDNNGNYEPGNVEWRSREDQQNNRRNNRLVTCWNETHTIAEWVRDPRTADGLTPSLVWNRLELWGDAEAERVLTEEPDGRRKWTLAEKRRIVAMLSVGDSYAAIGRELGHCRQAISKWHKRYLAAGSPTL